MEIIYADNFNDLTVKMLGYHHDHCHHIYYGKTSDIPSSLQKYINKNKNYCFIYKEDKPLNYE